MALQSKIVICSICGKSVRARGLYGHKKLKHDTIIRKMTREELIDCSDSCHDSGNTKEKRNDSSEATDNGKSNQVESDMRSFKPTILDRINHYKANPEKAIREWEKLCTLKQRYSWVIYFDSYKALSRIFCF